MVSYGVTAIGWNGVYLRPIAKLAPPNLAGAVTVGSQLPTYAGAVVMAPLFG